MKNKLQQFIVKLLAATLAIIMAVPTNVFAMSQRKSNTYTAATSVMGIQPKDDAPETETSQETNLLKSAVSTEETTNYIIEKSANLSQTIGQVTYKIAVKTKDPSKEFTENQTTTFGITENTDLTDLKVEKVQALDADGKEIDVKSTLNTPKAFNSTDNIRTLGITATKPQYGMVYYLSAQLTEEALKNLEEKSPQLALDITIASPNQDIFQTRYSLETTKPDTTEITIDNDGNLANQTSELVEKEDNLHLYKGEYKKEEKTLFQTTPAHLVWTDYINAKDDKEFTLDFDLDENQDTENSQIKIDYYEARDKGYILNQSFSKTVDFTNSLNLTIPQGYIAKVSLTTAIKENTNAKEYTFNGVKVANPTYKEEKNQMTEEEQATDDADPLPDDSSKNDEETKPSNDSIADESKQDFSQNPKSDTSAIALNNEAYLEKLRNEEKLTENLEKATNDIELALESYNKEETNWDEFKATIQTIAKEQNLDQAQTEETLQALLAGLNEDKYKVANIDTKEATNLVEESTDQSDPTDTTEKSVDELVKEKLNEEGITIEDFQNYMYELEEKYGLTDEDAARIYGDNAEAIQALAEKARQEKTTGDVFAVNTSNPYYGKNFHLITEMKALAAPTWQIPAGYWFDVNLGPYLKLKDGQQIKPLTDPSNPNRTIATGSYDARAHKIRYTFPQSVSVTKNLPINEVLTYDVENIERDFGTNPSSIPVKITIKPKNNPLQVMDTINVPSNTNGEFGTLVQKPGSNPQDAFRKLYPHDINYYSHQYYNTANGTINWDIEINTKEIKLDHLNYGNAALSLYAPKYQGLDNYSITIKNKPTDFQNEQGLNSVVTSGNEKTFQTTNTWNKETSNEIQIASRSFTKEELPDVLYVHVESKLADNQPRNAWYDLGIRLTPDNNYISDLIWQFNGEWEKLQAAMPWVIPWKSGDTEAKRFEDGFNVIDTRLPANIYGIADSQFDRKVYADKSRSVYASYDPTSDTDKNITWHISETIRLQDDQSTIGDDIFNASFENNTTKPTNPDIEILEPRSDGSYNRIYQTKSPNNPSNASSLRNWINSNRPDGLIPGTIINYVYHTTAVDVNQDATIKIDFNNRFDDGAGTYGGVNLASIRKLKLNEFADNQRYHIGWQPRYVDGTKPNTWSFDFNDGFIFRIFENHDMVFCINPGIPEPINNKFWTDPNYRIEKEVATVDNLAKRLPHGPNGEQYGRFTPEKVLEYLKKTFYYAEQIREEKKLDDYHYSIMVWDAVQDIVISKEGWDIINNPNNQYYYPLNDNTKLLLNKVYNTTDWNEEKESSVTINIYGNTQDSYKGIVGAKGIASRYTNQWQNMISGKVIKPIKFSKISEDNKPLSKATFRVKDINNKIIKEFNTNNKDTELYLSPGKYYIEEVKAPDGYKKLDRVEFEIISETERVEKNDIPLIKHTDNIRNSTDYGYNYTQPKPIEETVRYQFDKTKIYRDIDQIFIKSKPSFMGGGNYIQEYYKLNLTPNEKNIDSYRNQLVSLNNENIKITAKNILDNSKVKINKIFEDEDGNTSPLPGIDFELKKQGLLGETKTAQTKLVRDDRKGLRAIAEFTDLEPGTTWTLSEKNKSGLEPINVTWTVTVSKDNKVSIQAKNDTNKISSIDDENGQVTINVTNKPETPVYGSFKIIKVNSDNITEKLSGASFILKDEAGKTIKEASTDDQGSVSFDNLKPGTYTLKETKAPNEYQVDPDNDTWTVTVDKDTGKVTIKDESGNSKSGNTLEYTIKNKKVPSYEFKIRKVNEYDTNNPIEGATFILTGPNQSDEPIEMTTGKKGIISFGELEPGTYTLKEKSPAPGYQNTDKYWTIVITPEGKTYYRVNSNSNNVASNDNNLFTEDKVLYKSSNVLSNAANSLFNLFDTPVAYAASNVGGSKYEISNTKNQQTFGGTNVTTSVKDLGNNEFEVQIDLKNVDEKRVDNGGELNFTFNDDFSFVLGSTTTWKGNFDNAPTTRWHIGYDSNYKKINFALNEPKTYRNQTASIRFRVKAKDSLQAGSYNIINPIKYRHDTRSDVQTIDPPVITVKGPTISYREESVRTNIPIPSEPERRSNSNMLEGEENVITNGEVGYRIDIYKYKYIDGVKQPNPEFVKNETIVNPKPKIIEYGTKADQRSDSTTLKHVLEYETKETPDDTLPLGETKVDKEGRNGYIIYEYSIVYEKSGGEDASRPNDWPSNAPVANKQSGERVISYNKKAVEIDEPQDRIVRVGNKFVPNGEFKELSDTQYLEITNKPVELKIIKRNSEDKELSGAVFTLYSDKDAKSEINIEGINASQETGTDGVAKFGPLPNGTYYLKETKAPADYVLLPKIWEIEVTDGKINIRDGNEKGKYEIVDETSNELEHLIVINNKPTYPSTGGSGTFIGFALIGTAVMLAGIAYYGIYVNDKNRRRSNRYGK